MSVAVGVGREVFEAVAVGAVAFVAVAADVLVAVATFVFVAVAALVAEGDPPSSGVIRIK